MKYLISTIHRELGQMFARPLYLFSSVVVIIVSGIFYLTLMSSGAPERMPIMVVDHDCSSISRRVIHELNATPSVEIQAVVPEFAYAREKLQQGEIYGILEIPDRFYADLASQRQPKVRFYVSYAYTMGGTTAYKQLMTLANLINGAFLQQVLKLKGQSEYHIMDIVQPIALEAHMLYNPWGNYPMYLATTLLPGTLGLIALMLTVFAIGYELKTETTHDWLRTAGGSYHIALLGKLIPYTLLYWLLGIGIVFVLDAYMMFPEKGDNWWLVLNMCCFTVAMQAFGVILIGLLPVLRDAVSASALLGMMSFTMSGFTFPNMGMLSFIRSISYLFPLRHYYMVYVNDALLGAEWWRSMPYFGAYLIFVLAAVLVKHRLYNAMVELNYPKK